MWISPISGAAPVCLSYWNWKKKCLTHTAPFRKDSKDLGNRLGWLCLPEHLEQEELERVQQAAAEIRAASSALVIVGSQQACDCSRGVVELLCGTQPDLRPGQTKLIYCPDSLSSHAFQDLMGKLEEIEFSVLVIAGAEMRLQTAVLLRSLRWMMQRLFGTEKANERIYVVTELTRGTLCRLAGEENWTRFDLGRTVGSRYDSLSAAGLLPMAVAGIDIAELTSGARPDKRRFRGSGLRESRVAVLRKPSAAQPKRLSYGTAVRKRAPLPELYGLVSGTVCLQRGKQRHSASSHCSSLASGFGRFGGLCAPAGT